jgi:hypothetical protein
MLTKEIKMNDTGKSSFERLVDYITNDQGNELRIQDVTITNCSSTDLKEAVGEIQLDQLQNKRTAKDKTLHVLLSFRASDEANLTPELRQKIEQDFCEQIGFGKHQRISAYHGDTDNPHIHIAINRIDPETFSINNPKGLWAKMAKAAEAIEKKYQISMLNHRGEKTHSENLVNDAEAMSNEQTLCSYIKSIEALKKAQSWADFHRICREHNLTLKLRGNGIVFTDGNIFVKASTIDRNFSKGKLEKLYGKFIDDEQSSEFEQSQNDISISNNLNQASSQDDQSYANNTYKKGKPKESLYTDEQKKLFDEFVIQKEQVSYQKKKELYFSETKQQLHRLVKQREKEFNLIRTSRMPSSVKRYMYQKLNSQIAKDRQMYIYAERYMLRKLREQATWKGFLHTKALEGNQTAIELLESKKQQKYNAEKLQELEGRLKKTTDPVYITKSGTRIYHTKKHYIHISKDRIKIQEIKSEKQNLQTINWKQGFSGTNFVDLVKNDPEVDRLMKEENEKHLRDKQRQAEIQHQTLMARVMAAREFEQRKKVEASEKIKRNIKRSR